MTLVDLNALTTNIKPVTDSMMTIKAFLMEQGITIEVGASDRKLRILAMRRKIRLRHSLAVEKPIRGMLTALSLTQFKAKLEKMNADNYGPKDFVCFNCKLNFTEVDVIVMRHSESCRSIVKDGFCSTCNEETDGVPCFSISMMVADLEDANAMYNLIGYHSVGQTIFGKGATAELVHKMPRDKVLDILEDWAEVPLNVHCILEYDIKRGKTRVSPYNLVQMPIDYLTEYV